MKNYFPYPGLDDEVINLEKKIKKHTRNATETDRYGLYEAFSQIMPGLSATKFKVYENNIVAEQNNTRIKFPRPIPINNMTNIVCGYEKWLKHKYSLPGFVEVEENDIVVDCGSYVGGFTLSAASIAKEIHLFEPSEENIECIKFNTGNLTNVFINKSALHCENGMMNINISDSSVEHSFLTPDAGNLVEKRLVQTQTLKTYSEIRNLKKIDFVKLEAEGVEIEVLAGLDDLAPRKLAIDVSPERNQKSPAQEIKDILRYKGYETSQRLNVLFAKK